MISFKRCYLDDKALHTHIELGTVANTVQEVKDWKQSTDFNADHLRVNTQSLSWYEIQTSDMSLDFLLLDFPFFS